jgi:cytochrome c553
VRAQQLTGDAWAEDPGCYLDDEEIGVVPSASELTVTPHITIRRAHELAASLCRPCLSLAYLAVFAGSPAARRWRTTTALYQEHCAACHGETRLGGVGPALLPENLERLRKPEALNVIRDGRVATQMPAFGDKLSADEAQQLADWIYRPVFRRPSGGEAEIRGSHVVDAAAARPAGATRAGAEGRRPAEPVHRRRNRRPSCLGARRRQARTPAPLPSRYALHGGPKFSPDGRFVYFASRDGWISKFDLYNLVVVAETRAGLNTRNAAVSGDGKWVMVANYLPHNLVLLDARISRW